MKIILSPTKSMKRKSLDIGNSDPLFYDKSETLRNILKTYDFNALKKLYKSSDKIIETTLDYYKNEKESIQALSLYDGLVYKQLNLDSYTDIDLDYLNTHVIILSALYGALKPSSLIKEYRLDYLMKFEIDLDEYWNETLTQYFKDEKLILNLASSEFSNSFKHDNIVHVHFVDKNLKVKSTAAKMARGKMLDYLIVNKIDRIEDVIKYDQMNYKYQASLSDDHNIYFMQED